MDTAREELQNVFDEFAQITQSVASDAHINSYELRTVLRFLTKVVNVVDQAFQDVLSILIEVKFLEPSDFGSHKIRQLQKELELLRARSKYRDAEEICSRLKHLSSHFDGEIAPIVNKLNNPNQWSRFYFLLQEHEGGIIDLVNRTTWILINMLDNMHDPSHIKDISLFASKKADTIRQSLTNLQLLNNQILGLSGRSGFLELTEDRLALSQQVTFFINNIGGDNIQTGNITDSTVGIGHNASARNNLTNTENKSANSSI